MPLILAIALHVGCSQAQEKKAEQSVIKADTSPLDRLPLEPVVQSAPSQTVGIFVGVNDFQDRSFPPLNYAVNDAIAQAFVAVVELKLIAPNHCYLFLSGLPTPKSAQHLQKLIKLGAPAPQPATKEAVIQALRQLPSNLPKASLILCSLSAHGFAVGGEAYVIGHDTKRSILTESAIKLSDVEFRLEQTEANHRLLLIDACQERIATKDPNGEMSPRAKMTAEFNAALQKNSGQMKVTSCSPGQFSYEDHQLEQGAFTAALLDALRAKAIPTNANNIIDLQSVLDATRMSLKLNQFGGTQSISVSGELTALRMPLGIRPPGDLMTLLGSLKAKQQRHAAEGFLESHLEQCRDLLVSFEATQVRDQELLAVTRDYLADRITTPQYVKFLERGRLPGVFVNSVSMGFRWIPARSLLMGLAPGEPENYKNDSPHQVTVTEPFLIGETEVTQQQYQIVMGVNPSAFSATGQHTKAVEGMNTDEFPVESVSWHDAKRFINELNNLPAEKKAGRIYALPTEAQWEVAAADGGNRAFGTRAVLSWDEANFDWTTLQPGAKPPAQPKLGRPCPVASYPQSNLGLFDMHGNVDEWCEDAYCKDYQFLPQFNPRYEAEGGRVIRGGGWENNWLEVRRSARWEFQPKNHSRNLGFRVVCAKYPGETPTSDLPDNTASLLVFNEDFCGTTDLSIPENWKELAGTFRIDRFSHFPYLIANRTPTQLATIALPKDAINLLQGDFVLEIDFWIASGYWNKPEFGIEIMGDNGTARFGTWIGAGSIYLNTANNPAGENWGHYIPARPFPGTLRIDRTRSMLTASLLKVVTHEPGFHVEQPLKGKVKAIKLHLYEDNGNGTESARVSAVRIFRKPALAAKPTTQKK